MRYVYVLLVLVLFGSCSLDGGGTEVSCDIALDPTLLENPPEDTVWIEVNSGDVRFDRIFRGVRRVPQLGNPVEGNYTNAFTYERRPEFSDELMVSLGTQIVEEDSVNVTLAFNFQETVISDQICRSNKTIRTPHNWSDYKRNQQGAELRMVVKVDDVWMEFTTDGEDTDDLELVLEGVEVLDEFSVYGRLQGRFEGVLKQVFPESTTPMRVSVSGNFIFNTQIGYIL